MAPRFFSTLAAMTLACLASCGRSDSSTTISGTQVGALPHGTDAPEDPEAPQPVPEPATMLLFGAGMTGIAVYRRRRLALRRRKA